MKRRGLAVTAPFLGELPGEQEEGVQRSCLGDSLQGLPLRTQQQLCPRHTHVDSSHSRQAKYPRTVSYEAEAFLWF